MWAVGRILLVLVIVVGVVLVAAGTATLVGADDWAEQLDDINLGIDIDSGVFMEGNYGGLALGAIFVANNIIANLKSAEFMSW